MRRFLQTIMTALCLAAAVSGYWIWSAQQLRDGLADWRREAETEGRRVGYGAPRVTGFPFQLALSLETPTVEAPGEWQWSGPDIRAESWIFRPQDLSVTAPGAHRLTFAEGRRLGEALVNLRQAKADIHLDGKGRLSSTALALADVSGTIDRALHFDLAALAAVVTKVAAGADTAAPRIDLDLQAADFSLHSNHLDPFSSDIQKIALKGRLYAWQAKDWNRAALAHWRDRDGRLDVDRLDLVWDDLTMTASGQLALDDKLRPQGELDAWWRGLADVIDRLTAAKRIKAEAALVLKFGLMALPARTAPDGTTEINLPLSFDKGQLFLGPVPVARLKPL